MGEGMTASLNITLNGEARRVATGSIADLVRSLELDPVKVAVERNRAIIIARGKVLADDTPRALEAR